MSKRKQRSKPQPASGAQPASTAQPAAKPQPASTAHPKSTTQPASTAQRAAKPLPTPAASQGSRLARRLWPLYFLLTFVGVAVAGLWLTQRQQAAPAATPTPIATPTDMPLPVGSVSYCRHNARFAPKVGLGDAVNASTSERMIKGLVMYNADLASDQVQLGAPGVYQHPTWDDAGYLGPVASDGVGNIYTAPSPRVSLIDNPPAGANTIYKVDTETGEMKPLVTLPASAPPSSANAYGILGLAYDCDTASLYASSVAGSTRSNEVGRLFQIDASSGKILSQYDNVDAIGVGVFNGATGKRLYYGGARAPEVRSLALDSQGSIVGGRRTDIVLSEVPPYWDLRARRIVFPAQTTDMTVRAVEFNYNLVAMSEARQANYQFTYDPANDEWTIVSDLN